jgi:hypothetical protein
MSEQQARSANRMIGDAQQLIDALGRADVTARLLGGLAVAIRCPSARTASALLRRYSDFDMVVDRRSRRRLPEALEAQGFEAASRFNTVNGHSRQLYRSPAGIDLDVFVERFSMCHELDLADRLTVDATTLPLADLVLTKLQVADLADKDVVDFTAIALDHDIGADDAGISVQRITSVVGDDWGWWRTVTDNLVKVCVHVQRLELEPAQADRARRTAETLLAEIQRTPKSMRWKLRGIVGERAAWRQDPEEK